LRFCDDSSADPWGEQRRAPAITHNKKKSGTTVTKRLRGVFLDALRWLEQQCKQLSPSVFAKTIKELFQNLWKT
jgi:hypothetical protein